MASSTPPSLLAAIQSGDCVAFVGSGFSAVAGLPGWTTLLKGIAKRVPLDDTTRSYILGRIGVASAHALDEAAQALEDALGPEQLLVELRLELQLDTLPQSISRRLKWLAGIPFRAVLTTNFDGVLPGRFADLETYANVLRAPALSR